ncbi:MAG: Ig-like domain-containing protein, partial [Firmicutes bacterium]|nr:Ig-like domain-containing protein [Bacillota bacterium]
MKQTIRKALALFMTIALVATTITFTAGNTLQAEEQAPPEVSQETSEPAKADAPATTPEPEKSEPVTETQTMNLSQDEPDDEDYESAPADNEKKNPANEKKDNDKDKKGKKLSGSEADLYVNVADPKDALPDGASIKLREANPENIKALIQNYYGSDAEVKGVQAVDISFVKDNGKSAKPSKSVNVTISGIDISGDNMALFHISGSGADYVKEVSGSSVSFSAGSFSPYAIASYEKKDSNKNDVDDDDQDEDEDADEDDDAQNMGISGPKTVYVGDSIILTSDKGNNYHEWKSSDSSKATVSGSGKSATVTGVAAADRVTITHYYYERNGSYYSKHSEEYTVTVLANNASSTGATSLTLDKTSVMLNTIGATETVRATTSGLNDDEFVTWTSSNEKVATVNNGVITAVDEGNATVTATVTHYGENDEPVVLSKTV